MRHTDMFIRLVKLRPKLKAFGLCRKTPCKTARYEIKKIQWNSRAAMKIRFPEQAFPGLALPRGESP
ncbi:hypothetical protein K0M31_014695, partial [Melipona bicolor]